MGACYATGVLCPSTSLPASPSGGVDGPFFFGRRDRAAPRPGSLLRPGERQLHLQLMEFGAREAEGVQRCGAHVLGHQRRDLPGRVGIDRLDGG